MIKALNNARVLLGFVVALQAFFLSDADRWVIDNVVAAWGFSEPWANALFDLAMLLLVALVTAWLAVKIAAEGPLWGAGVALAAGAAAVWFGSRTDHVAAALSDPRVHGMDRGVVLAWAILAAGAFAVPVYRLVVRRRYKRYARQSAAELRRLERRESLDAGQPRWRQVGMRSYLEFPQSPVPPATPAKQAAQRARMHRIVEYERAKAEAQRSAAPQGAAPAQPPA